MNKKLYDIALKHVKSDISIIPIYLYKLNEKIIKKPAKDPQTNTPLLWKQYQHKIIDEETLKNIFDHSHVNGFACIAGSFNGIELIDFDLKNSTNKNLFTEFINKIPEELKNKLVIQSTINEGYHIIYRFNKPGKNIVLAKSSENKPVIETRGEGGYFLLAPSKGYSYTTTQKTIFDAQELTIKERRLLFKTAKKFCKEQKEVSKYKQRYDKEILSIQIKTLEWAAKYKKLKPLLTYLQLSTVTISKCIHISNWQQKIKELAKFCNISEKTLKQRLKLLEKYNLCQLTKNFIRLKSKKNLINLFEDIEECKNFYKDLYDETNILIKSKEQFQQKAKCIKFKTKNLTETYLETLLYYILDNQQKEKAFEEIIDKSDINISDTENQLFKTVKSTLITSNLGTFVKDNYININISNTTFKNCFNHSSPSSSSNKTKKMMKEGLISAIHPVFDFICSKEKYEQNKEFYNSTYQGKLINFKNCFYKQNTNYIKFSTEFLNSVFLNSTRAIIIRNAWEEIMNEKKLFFLYKKKYNNYMENVSQKEFIANKKDIELFLDKKVKVLNTGNYPFHSHFLDILSNKETGEVFLEKKFCLKRRKNMSEYIPLEIKLFPISEIGKKEDLIITRYRTNSQGEVGDKVKDFFDENELGEIEAIRNYFSERDIKFFLKKRKKEIIVTKEQENGEVKVLKSKLKEERINKIKEYKKVLKNSI